MGRSEIEDFLPRIYGADYVLGSENQRRGYYLVMEDLSVDFTMVPNKDGLSLRQTLAGIEAMARLHAVSYCYGIVNNLEFPEEKRPPFLGFLSDDETVKLTKSYFAMAVKDFNENPKAKHLAPYIEKLSTDFVASFKKTYEVDRRFMIHGDMWSNNVMFSHNNNGNVSVKVIDWQFYSTGSPYTDFNAIAFINAKPSEVEVTKLNIVIIFFP